MNKERLLKLADHLEHGTLGHDKFDFGTYHETRSCGTAGCAIGECPFVWPEWKFDEDEFPVLDGFDTAHQSGMEWFEISEEDYDHLFVPVEALANGVLPLSATRNEVAANIRAFVEGAL